MNVIYRLFALLVLVAVAAGGYAAASFAQEAAAKPKRLEFEVAENVTRFVADEAPVFEDGMPAPGNVFITEGYIYPVGTLNGSNGVIIDAEGNARPEFPDKVIGTWICRGWFISDGAHTAAGPVAITTQTYQFGEAYGNAMIVSDGYESSELHAPIKRAIVGATGEYKQIRGEVTQELLGFNEAMAVNLRFTIAIK